MITIYEQGTQIKVIDSGQTDYKPIAKVEARYSKRIGDYILFDDNKTYEITLKVGDVQDELGNILTEIQIVDFLDSNVASLITQGGGSSITGGATESTLLEVKDLLAYSNTSQSIITGANINVPSGFKSVLINSLGGTQILDFGGGNTFEIGGGRRPTILSFEANELNSKNGLLGAITITGGTWQWVATNPITL